VRLISLRNVKKAAGNGSVQVGAFPLLARDARNEPPANLRESWPFGATQAEAAVEALALRAIADRK